MYANKSNLVHFDVKQTEHNNQIRFRTRTGVPELQGDKLKYIFNVYFFHHQHQMYSIYNHMHKAV